MALFPPGKGGGKKVAYGGKGKGILIHTLTEGNGMPLSNSTTPANGNEREQVLPLLDKVKLKTLKRGRPRLRLKVLAADKGYDSKQQRASPRKNSDIMDRPSSTQLSVAPTSKGFKGLSIMSGFIVTLRKRGIRPQIPKRVRKTKKNFGRPIKISVPRFQQERCFAWYQRKYRRLAVRWERRQVYFDAFIDLATIHLWVKRILLVG